jgi:crossover junction endodeoxyribonuclease RuvC
VIVLGIDPGYAIVGYGILDYNGTSFRVIDYGSIETDAKEPFVDRIQRIYKGLCFLIEKYHIEEMAIEELFFFKNAKTVIDVAQARGVMLLAAKEHNIPVYEYTPLQVKQGICGYGKAPKEQVQQMVKTTLRLKEVPKPDDTADALAIATNHCHTSRFSKLFQV